MGLGQHGEHALYQEAGLTLQVDPPRKVQPVDDVAIQCAVEQGGGTLQVKVSRQLAPAYRIGQGRLQILKKCADSLRICSRSEMASPSSDSRLNNRVNICRCAGL